MKHDAIAVIDFGGQYAHLIATKVRRHHVLAEIRQPEDPIEMFQEYRGIILSGSPALSSHGEDSAYTKEIYDLALPIMEQLIMQGKVVEPLADLYKVEVRELGEKLGIPPEAIWRHPFPGPGLGVRLLCSDGAPDDSDLAGIEDSLGAIAGRYGLESIILPIKSVGVKADLRSYEHPVMFSGQGEWKDLVEAAGSVFNDVPGINRCVWNLADEAPTSTRPLAATMTRERLDLLRDVDDAVMRGLVRHGNYADIWQCPTVLVPLEINGKGRELCIVRPIHSERAMTATAAALPPRLIEELRKDILSLPGISGLALDLTSKPPGTIEWE